MKLETVVLDFLNKHRIGVLATITKDNYPHTAVMHYANNDSGELFFMTEKSGKKSEHLLDGSNGNASFVTGFSDEEWITLQMDGEIQVISKKEELKAIHKVYFKKNPGPEKYKNDPETLFLKFIPKWWRYTEYKPKFKAISSEK